MKTTSRKKLSAAQIAYEIEQGYATFDDARAAAMRGLLRIREAKAKSLERGMEVAQENGDRNSARIYTALAENNNRLIGSLKREVALSETPIPARQKNAAAVHGYVWRQTGTEIAPAAKVRVAVFEPTGETDKKLVETKTDKRGYFKMSVPVKETREEPVTDKSAGIGTRERNVRKGRIAVLGSSAKEPLAAKSIPLTADSLSFSELVLTEDSERGKRRRPAASRATVGKRRGSKKR